MSRLPIPGQDQGTWGDILNDFLQQSHSTSGTLKSSSVGSSQLQPNSVAASHIQDSAVTTAAIADEAISTSKLADNLTLSGGTLANKKQSIQLLSATSAQWRADTTTILAAGEAGFVSDMRDIILGDGSSNAARLISFRSSHETTFGDRRSRLERILQAIGQVPTKGIGLNASYSTTSDTPTTSSGTVDTITSNYSDAYGIESQNTRWTPYGITHLSWNSTYGYTSHGTNGYDGGPQAWGFTLTGTEVELTWRAGTSTDYHWLWIDGKPTTPTAQTPSGISISPGGIYRTKITFSTSSARRIVWYSFYGQLVKIRTSNANSTISPLPSTRASGRIFCVGDSYLGGSAGISPFQTWGWKIGFATGMEMFFGGQGGTGYISPGSFGARAFTDTSRLDPIVTANPDVVLIFLGGNDSLQSASAVYTAAMQSYQYIYDRAPQVPLVVAGTYPSNTTDTFSASRSAVNKALRDAAVASPNVIGYIDPIGTSKTGATPAAYSTGTTYSVNDIFTYNGGIYKTFVQHTAGATPNGNYVYLIGWYTGTGNTTSPGNNGNRDICLSSDGVHPTALGQYVIAQRLLTGLEQIVSSWLSGTTFTDIE